ncbi:leucine-rich repeat-containing protein 27 isoform X2 [Talpa occidentalis]|uniref:leucine-rich repeat-containing protein 27 isoform X2 n=1 Tax=Talpa occidentalis TaxID=50954 RepID=UPI0023F7E283|nr:leucine-rich repeat-containing protein 27 isoform X2 [Talpa occidentalis]
MERRGACTLSPEAADPEGRGRAGSPAASPSKGAVFFSAPVLDLSQRGLHHLGEIFKIPNLTQLHLQRNALGAIPKDFFQLLPNLTWLDLRFNRIRVLPSGIGAHKHLRTLLLEKNPIRMLPVELGHVSTLRALNLRQCPLEFPPQLIVQKGLVSILTFLRICAAECPAPGELPPPESTPGAGTELGPLPLPRLGLSAESAPGREPGESPEPQAPAMPQERGDLLPPVDRLGLRGPRRAEALDDWPSREEIRRFWKLRQEIVEQEQAEAPGTQLLPIELPPNLKAALSSREKGGRRRGFRDTLPDLQMSSQEGLRARRLQQGRAPGCGELWHKRALLGPHQRDARALQECREQARRPQWREALWTVQSPHKGPVASGDLFAADLERETASPPPARGMGRSKEGPSHTRGAASGPRGRSLEHRLKPQPQWTHEGRGSLRGAEPLARVRRAAQNLEIARTLQDEVAKLKLESTTLNRNHQFPTLSTPGSPAAVNTKR